MALHFGFEGSLVNPQLRAEKGLVRFERSWVNRQTRCATRIHRCWTCDPRGTCERLTGSLPAFQRRASPGRVISKLVRKSLQLGKAVTVLSGVPNQALVGALLTVGKRLLAPDRIRRVKAAGSPPRVELVTRFHVSWLRTEVDSEYRPGPRR